jgi:hypothetical protein
VQETFCSLAGGLQWQQLTAESNQQLQDLNSMQTAADVCYLRDAVRGAGAISQSADVLAVEMLHFAQWPQHILYGWLSAVTRLNVYLALGLQQSVMLA